MYAIRSYYGLRVVSPFTDAVRVRPSHVGMAAPADLRLGSLPADVGGGPGSPQVDLV